MKLMKFTLVYVIAIVILSVNGVLSKPRRKRAPGPPGVGKVVPPGPVGPPGVGKVVPPGPVVQPGLPGPPEPGPVGPVGPTDYCDGKTRSDGTQNPKGSCSTFIQGDIPSSDKMPSSLIVNPKNGGSVAANQAFTVDLVVANIETGQFSDPATQYNSIPQSLNGDGFILGHTHVTIQGLSSDSTPPDSSQFAFFKGVNDKADPQGKISVNVVDEQGKAGLPSGNYRICTMTSSFSHQPAVMPVAKRGSQDDCIRITVQ